MSAIAAILLGRERRMVARFIASGATSRERARTLAELGLSSGIILHRLENRAVVRHAPPDRYYVDEESWAAVRRSRRRAVSVVGAILLALLLALLFGSRRAISGQELRRSWSDATLTDVAGERQRIRGVVQRSNGSPGSVSPG